MKADDELTDITLRDHIAIQAMASILSTESEDVGYYSGDAASTALLTEKAYRVADAMIAESQK